MGDIKFRAWDKKKNNWFDDEGSLYIELNGNINFGWNGEVMDDYTDRVILLQYTGLKDKNGIEIYEGDIVKASSTGIWGKFQVKWRQDGSPCWIMYPAWKSGITWSLHGTLNDKSEYQDDVEVIGNIYENPELLED